MFQCGTFRFFGILLSSAGSGRLSKFSAFYVLIYQSQITPICLIKHIFNIIKFKKKCSAGIHGPAPDSFRTEMSRTQGVAHTVWAISDKKLFLKDRVGVDAKLNEHFKFLYKFLITPTHSLIMRIFKFCVGGFTILRRDAVLRHSLKDSSE